MIEKVRQGWGTTIRDGYGQTETTAQVGNPPGQLIKPGSMGRPLPGYKIALLDGEGNPADEGEISIDLSARPAGLMAGYQDDPTLTEFVTRDGHYHTGDVAMRDADGYITYVGRADDVFKSSDYRISPFELESALIEHAAVAEAAVVPSADPVRGDVPKAFLILKPARSPPGNWPRTSSSSSGTGSPPTSGCGASSSPTCPRPSREDPARAASRPREGAAGPGRARTARVLAGGVPRAEGLTRNPLEPRPRRADPETKWLPASHAPSPSSAPTAPGRPPSSRPSSAPPTPGGPARRAPPRGSTPTPRRRSATSP